MHNFGILFILSFFICSSSFHFRFHSTRWFFFSQYTNSPQCNSTRCDFALLSSELEKHENHTKWKKTKTIIKKILHSILSFLSTILFNQRNEKLNFFTMKFWKQIKFLRNLAPKHETRKKIQRREKQSQSLKLINWNFSAKNFFFYNTFRTPHKSSSSISIEMLTRNH